MTAGERGPAHPGPRLYLSRNQFRELYGSVFPGARFDDLGFALAMAWTAPPSGGEVQ